MKGSNKTPSNNGACNTAKSPHNINNKDGPNHLVDQTTICLKYPEHGQDGQLACISIGYANGYRRNGHERGAVAINNNICPIVGKVSMNTIVADVTDIHDVNVGDEVVIFGGEHASMIGSELVEQQFETIMADLYADWGLRNPRIYR